MKATTPDQAGPCPGPESTEARLAAAEAADHGTIRARDEEESFASKHSRPTRILGCLTLGGIAIEVASAYRGQHMQLGGALFLIAGIMILKGSQAWVRFVALAGSIVSLSFIFRILEPLATGGPVVMEGEWFSYGDVALWILCVCPAVYLLAECILAFAVLRHRQLPFWTKPIKIWTAILGTVFLIQNFRTVAHDLRNKELVHRFPVEIRKAEDYFKAHGTWSYPPSHADAEKLMSSPVLHSVTLSTQSGGGIVLPTKNSSVPPDQLRKATHYVKLPSGEWGKLEIGFIVDESP